MIEYRFVGNREFLELRKTAFLASRKIPAIQILKCYDWATAMRDQGNCVISGFHSQIERDVFHYLSKGRQPIIVALARGLKRRQDPMIDKLVSDGCCLVISPFDDQVTRITPQTSAHRNEFMLDLADSVTVGYAAAGGQLETLLKKCSKPVTFL